MLDWKTENVNINDLKEIIIMVMMRTNPIILLIVLINYLSVCFLFIDYIFK